MGIWSRKTQVRLSRSASVSSFATNTLNLGLTHGIPPNFRGGVLLNIPPSAIGSVLNLSGHVIVYDVHCRESASTRPVALKVVPATVAVFAGITMDQSVCASLFPYPILIRNGHGMYDTENIGGGSMLTGPLFPIGIEHLIYMIFFCYGSSKVY